MTDARVDNNKYFIIRNAHNIIIVATRICRVGSHRRDRNELTQPGMPALFKGKVLLNFTGSR